MVGSTELWLRADSGARQLGLESHSATSQQYDLEQTLTSSLSFLMCKRKIKNYTYLST